MIFVTRWFVVFCLVFCAAPVFAQETSKDYGEQVRVIFSDNKAAKALKVADANARKKGRLTQAFVKVMNGTTKQYKAEYVVAWEDADGFPIESTTQVWETLFLAGREERSINLVGKHRKAHRLIMTIRTKS